MMKIIANIYFNVYYILGTVLSTWINSQQLCEIDTIITNNFCLVHEVTEPYKD